MKINDIQIEKLKLLLKYSDRYEVSIQFWPDQTTVFIEKNGVDLQSYGGDFDYAIGESIKYLDKINKKLKSWHKD